MILVLRHAARRGAKNPPSNYRLVVNENHNYTALANTSGLSARRRNTREEGSTSAARLSHKVRSGVLNRLHIDSAKLNNTDLNKLKGEEEVKDRKRKKEKETEREKTRHHEDHYRYHHEKGTCTTTEPISLEVRWPLSESTLPHRSTTTTKNHKISASEARSLKVTFPQTSQPLVY